MDGNEKGRYLVNIELFQILETATLRDALVKVESNHHGMILAIDEKGSVTGLATDGDVRRKLLEGASLDDAIATCVNRNFVWADMTCSRELLLKRLDQAIRIIPVLDKNRRLTGIVSRKEVPRLIEETVYARARAPVRISFGGGGSDVTHYFSETDGAVLNTTISLYSHVTLRKRDDGEIRIHSRDLGESLVAASLREALLHNGRFGLIQSILQTVNPEFGFDLLLQSDFPMNSGLGGSAVVSAAVLGCFNQFKQDRWDPHEVAELAFQAERLYLGIAGGWQDQYATVFGGFNFMEFRMDQNIVHPLRVNPDTLLELEGCLILCDTGTTHDSGDIHQDQRQQMRSDQVRDLVRANVQLCYEMRNDLLRGRLLQFGRSMDKAWHLKRQFSNKISNKRLDEIYSGAMANGAIGGKVLGAGGGGFFLFYAHPFRKHELISHLETEGLKISPFRFESKGLQAWTVRESRNHLESEIQ
jgi:D-glycero-alpha-D-manno-heptose-7-phosphate kinase